MKRATANRSPEMSVENSISEEDLVPPSPIKKNFENPYIKVRRKEYDFDN